MKMNNIEKVLPTSLQIVELTMMLQMVKQQKKANSKNDEIKLKMIKC
jgi:hypothetical protein